MERAAARPLVIAIPNMLTYARIAAVPALVLCMLALDGDVRDWTAVSIFVAAGITDWLDGYLARIWAQQSSLGRMLDPIADKLLVGGALLMLVEDRLIDGISVIPAVVILSREILVSGLRDFLASLNVQVHVTWLAKCKTAAQMVAIAILLAGAAADRLIPGLSTMGVALLWGAAILTMWTGFDYLRAAVRHAIDH
jgi:CDP-diacylglycerol--glycerol-3-phosphate 3-phosphatidyltransferase/cardiolipin synthase